MLKIKLFSPGTICLLIAAVYFLPFSFKEVLSYGAGAHSSSQQEFLEDERFQSISIRRARLDAAFKVLVEQEYELTTNLVNGCNPPHLKNKEDNLRRKREKLEARQKVLDTAFERYFHKAFETDLEHLPALSVDK